MKNHNSSTIVSCNRVKTANLIVINNLKLSIFRREAAAVNTHCPIREREREGGGSAVYSILSNEQTFLQDNKKILQSL